MKIKNIYEHPKFYEIKMMIRGDRINHSIAFDSNKTIAEARATGVLTKEQALLSAIQFKEDTIKSLNTQGVSLARNPTKIKFIEIVDLYLLNKITAQKSKSKTENLLKLAKERYPDLMTTLLIDLTTKHFEKVKDSLIKNGYENSTVNHYLSQFSCILNYAKECGINVENLTKGLQLELDNVQDEILSRDELKTIISEFQNERTKLAIEFLFFTACRRSEAVRAKHSDIDYENKTLALKDTKNGKSHKVILNRSCIKIIERLKELDGGEGYIFKAYTDKKEDHLHIDCFTRAWRRAVKRIAKRTGDEKWLLKRLHTLRHSRITEYAAKVPNTIVLQDITGHKDLRSLSRYSHSTTATKRKLLGDLAEE